MISWSKHLDCHAQPLQHFFFATTKIPLAWNNTHNIQQHLWSCINYSLAVFFRVFAIVRAVEELAVEQLHRDYGEDELKQYVHNENVDDVFQTVHDTVEHRLELRHSFNSLEGSEHAKHTQRLDGREILAGAAAALAARHVEGERHGGADDDDRVHEVPELAQVRARMENHPEIDDLQDHLDGEDARERVVEVVQYCVAGIHVVHRILRGQRYAR